MAPKKAAAEAAPPPPPPPADPIVVEQQQKVDKWQARIADVAAKHTQYLTQQNTAAEAKAQFDRELASLLERATELATMRVFGIVPPSAQPAAAAASAPAAGKPLAGKGKGKPEPAPVVAPPVEVPLTDEEIKKRAKISNALLLLYKRKRDGQALAAAAPPMSPTAASADTAPPSPSAASVVDVPNRPQDIAEDIWFTMIALREDRLATEAKLAAAVQALKVLKGKLSSVSHMEHVAAYAAQGSDHDLKLAVAVSQERQAKEQQQAKEAAAAAVASPGLPPLSSSPTVGKGKK